MNASGEWDINSAQLSLCRVGMTRQSDSSIVFRLKKPVKFARALHRDSVPLKVHALHYANELLVRVSFPFKNFGKLAQHAEAIRKHCLGKE